MRTLITAVALFAMFDAANCQEMNWEDMVNKFGSELASLYAEIKGARAADMLISIQLGGEVKMYREPDKSAAPIFELVKGDLVRPVKQVGAFMQYENLKTGQTGWAPADAQVCIKFPCKYIEFAAHSQNNDSADRPPSWFVRQALEFKERWKDNEFVSIDGFSLSLSLSPSIDVEFSFK